MSQGERMARLLEEQGRFRSRQQTKDSHVHTLLVVQPKASRYIAPQNQTPTALSVTGTHIVSATDRGVPANVYNGGNAVPSCCSAVSYNGNSNFAGADGIVQQRQACAVCPTDNYWLYNGYAIDMSGPDVKGGVCCPLPNLPNTAKQTAAEKCANCLQFYFPSPTQPRCCYGTPYTSQYLYPRLPPSMETGVRFGDDRVPEQGCPPVSISAPSISSPGDCGPWVIQFNYTGADVGLNVAIVDGNGAAVENVVLGAVVLENGLGSVTITSVNGLGAGVRATAVLTLSSYCDGRNTVSVTQNVSFSINAGCGT